MSWQDEIAKMNEKANFELQKLIATRSFRDKEEAFEAGYLKALEDVENILLQAVSGSSVDDPFISFGKTMEAVKALRGEK